MHMKARKQKVCLHCCCMSIVCAYLKFFACLSHTCIGYAQETTSKLMMHMFRLVPKYLETTLAYNDFGGKFSTFVGEFDNVSSVT